MKHEVKTVLDTYEYDTSWNRTSRSDAAYKKMLDDSKIVYAIAFVKTGIAEADDGKAVELGPDWWNNELVWDDYAFDTLEEAKAYARERVNEEEPYIDGDPNHHLVCIRAEIYRELLTSKGVLMVDSTSDDIVDNKEPYMLPRDDEYESEEDWYRHYMAWYEKQLATESE